ncbi:hypothetical protein M8C21_024865, partial [Ambrosia artemisiifolia]
TLPRKTLDIKSHPCLLLLFLPPDFLKSPLLIVSLSSQPTRLTVDAITRLPDRETRPNGENTDQPTTCNWGVADYYSKKWAKSLKLRPNTHLSVTRSPSSSTMSSRLHLLKSLLSHDDDELLKLIIPHQVKYGSAGQRLRALMIASMLAVNHSSSESLSVCLLSTFVCTGAGGELLDLCVVWGVCMIFPSSVGGELMPVVIVLGVEDGVNGL